MKGHVHSGTNGRTIDHGHRRFTDETDVAVQLRKAMIEVLARGVGPLVASTCTFDIGADFLRRRSAFEIRTGAETAPDAGQYDDAYIGIIIASAHVLTYLRNGSECFGDAIECIHCFRSVELDPKNAAVFLVVEKVVDECWSHADPLLVRVLLWKPWRDSLDAAPRQGAPCHPCRRAGPSPWQSPRAGARGARSSRTAIMP